MTMISDSDAAVELATLNSSFRHRISWSSIFLCAVVGTAAIFFLLMLGAGVGLSLVPRHGLTGKGFLTLGAIYFVAAQAMGFAVGGHLVGRLIGPMAETDREEEFRAAAHGLGVWGICVCITAVLMLMSSWVAAGSSAVADSMRLGSAAPSGAAAPAEAAYWTDVLFRPATAPMHASLTWERYAQAATTATDASPATDDEAGSSARDTATRMTPVPENTGKVENDAQSANTAGVAESTSPVPSSAPHVITIPTAAEAAPTGSASPLGVQPGLQPQARSLSSDKGEVSRILEAGIGDGTALGAYDRQRIAELISQDIGLSVAEAGRRTDNALARIRAEESKSAETARKIARNTSLWVAFALLFGALVTTMAAISARWEDDRITFGFSRREPA